MRKTITQPWRFRLVFSRDHEEEIEMPGTMSARTAWREIRETFYPRKPSIRVITRGRKQLKV
jgi:hypothetical protein